VNSFLPTAIESAPPGVSAEGAGGARKRMKRANCRSALNIAIEVLLRPAIGEPAPGGPNRTPGFFAPVPGGRDVAAVAAKVTTSMIAMTAAMAADINPARRSTFFAMLLPPSFLVF
jgi:hypothetical protein